MLTNCRPVPLQSTQAQSGPTISGANFPQLPSPPHSRQRISPAPHPRSQTSVATLVSQLLAQKTRIRATRAACLSVISKVLIQRIGSIARRHGWRVGRVRSIADETRHSCPALAGARPERGPVRMILANPALIVALRAMLHQRSSRNPLKNGCRTLPSADLARYSTSANSFGSTQMPLCAIRFA